VKKPPYKGLFLDRPEREVAKIRRLLAVNFGFVEIWYFEEGVENTTPTHHYIYKVISMENVVKFIEDFWGWVVILLLLCVIGPYLMVYAIVLSPIVALVYRIWKLIRRNH